MIEQSTSEAGVSHQADSPQSMGLAIESDRLQLLGEISRVVSSTLDLRVLYDTIYEQVGRVMDTAHFFIALCDEAANTIDLTYHRENGRLCPPRVFPLANSLTAMVIQRDDPVLVNSEREYAALVLANGLPSITIGEDESEAKVWVPLHTGDRTIGALSVQSGRPNAYSREDLRILSIVAAQAAVAIENARLYGQSRHAAGRMQALLEVAAAVNSSLVVDRVMDAILSGIKKVLPYYFAAILLPNDTSEYLQVGGIVAPAQYREHTEALRATARIPVGEGVTGNVFADGRALVIPDVRAFPGYIDHGIGEIRSEIAVPLKRGDTVVGVLDIEHPAINAFSNDDVSLLNLFASQAAIALENARLFQEQQRRAFELQVIQSIVRDINPLRDRKAIAETISRELKLLIAYHSCRIFALDDQAGELEPVAVDGYYPPDFRPPIGRGVCGWIADAGEPILIPDLRADSRAEYIEGMPDRSESLIGAPLRYQDRVHGVITLTKLGVDQFDEHALRLLEIVAGQTAIAFDRARLYEELRDQAVTDELTRLYNRRYLLGRLRVEISRAMRNDHPLAVLLLDVDRFKQVNDRSGHDGGDAVLRELAVVLQKQVREGDIVTRFGGEEFCVVLPEVAADEAIQVAERVRVAVERHRMPLDAGVGHISISVGLAFLAPDDTELTVLTRADRAMYRGKRLGGNMVCVQEGDEEEQVLPSTG